MGVILLAAYPSAAAAQMAARLGVLALLSKPAAVEAVRRLAQEAATHLALGRPVPSLARAEWDHIQRALTLCEGNLSKTARILHIPRKTLQRKLQKNPPEE